jgi:hypothetical protein
VHVQVKESYAKSRWRIAWTDDEAIKRAFNNIKGVVNRTMSDPGNPRILPGPGPSL